MLLRQIGHFLPSLCMTVLAQSSQTQTWPQGWITTSDICTKHMLQLPLADPLLSKLFDVFLFLLSSALSLSFSSLVSLAVWKKNNAPNVATISQNSSKILKCLKNSPTIGPDVLYPPSMALPKKLHRTFYTFSMSSECFHESSVEQHW